MEILTQFSTRELRKLFESRIYMVFKEHGFTKLGKEYIREYHDKVFGMVSFSSYSQNLNNVLYVSMYLGFAQKDLSRLLYALLGRKTNKSLFCTGWKGLCYIIPEATYHQYEWRMTNESEINMACSSISDILSGIVEPFFENSGHYSRFKYNVINGGFCTLRKIVIPTIYYYDGDNQRAEEFINKQIMLDSHSYSSVNPLEIVYLNNFKPLLKVPNKP